VTFEGWDGGTTGRAAWTTALTSSSAGGTLSLINAELAQSRNRSGLIWGLLSLVLGPFATFLIVVLDKVRLDGERGQEDPTSSIIV